MSSSEAVDSYDVCRAAVQTGEIWVLLIERPEWAVRQPTSADSTLTTQDVVADERGIVIRAGRQCCPCRST